MIKSPQLFILACTPLGRFTLTSCPRKDQRNFPYREGQECLLCKFFSHISFCNNTLNFCIPPTLPLFVSLFQHQELSVQKVRVNIATQQTAIKIREILAISNAIQDQKVEFPLYIWTNFFVNLTCQKHPIKQIKIKPNKHFLCRSPALLTWCPWMLVWIQPVYPLLFK